MARFPMGSTRRKGEEDISYETAEIYRQIGRIVVPG